MKSFANRNFEAFKRAHKAASVSCALAALLFGSLIDPTAAFSADRSLPVTGNLLGSVLDYEGVPQIGAVVQVFNKYDRLVAKTLSTADGRFAFAGLPADVYSVRVSLASFLPAARDKIAVKAGLNSVLQVHLATLFSNIQLTYAIPDGAMNDDWKWVLRSSSATRPITRYLPELAGSSSSEMHPQVFSGTRAMLSVSGGDGGIIDSESNSGDFGTGFAVSTNIFGKNQVQVGGSFGQNAGFGPTAMGLCAIYSRSDDGFLGTPPEVTLTVAQLGTAGQLDGMQSGQQAAGIVAGTPLRAMSLGVYEVFDPVDGVHFEYGMTGETVDYLQHTSRISPFARLTVSLGNKGDLVASYSDGGRPDELTAHQEQPQSQGAEIESDNDRLMDSVNTLARLPQISERNDRLELQRTESYELGYRKTVGSRTYAASAFYEAVSNGRINVAGDTSSLDSGDLFWDGVSNTSTYNIGNYDRSGYIASLDQRVSQDLDLALAYGRMGGFNADTETFLTERNHNMAAADLRARIPGSGGQISASYGWVDSGTVVPRHIFTTQNIYVAPGLNIQFRQPLPTLFGLPGKFEITADLHNLLAQGYLPFDTGDGRKLLIVQSPRAIRGGLNFIF